MNSNAGLISPTPPSRPSAKGIVDLLHLAQRLKTTKRTGWIRREVQQPESIADHMYRMGIMSLVACPEEVDRERCIKISLVHDLAEAIVGDIPPGAGISKEEKARLEADAIKQIKVMLGDDTEFASEIEELFHEYEAGETAEAVLVKDFDKLEMILQASEYEEAQQMDLEPFFGSTAGSFRTETGRALEAEILARRAGRRGESPK
uniref:5'-deoxynucleotidase n=1 Tax=Tetraselmis sp. GSL018 TaxID=582737 RepID=A0A061RX06_9CHLO|eukprot:CAMPEP_0177607788 /NCGR_PEP_ID=MMETSP0419_2-20121207/18110_1 /TAXON_ID=582737 /ORGANISM="Tetraselmis sp., Strain GSL018" /LENGTH=204 /DNA_ID=CAMNT_0019102405 /DNA_START=52 /DNA_END=666 /DNA_ORIENTATION=-